MATSHQQILKDVESHPARAPMAWRVMAVMEEAFRSQQPQLLSGTEVAELELASLPPLEFQAADTGYGNVLEILDRGAASAEEWLLLSVLAGWAVEQRWSNPDAREDTLTQLLWLAANTPIDPWPTLDVILGPEARSALWGAIAAKLGENGATVDKQTQLVVALCRARSPEAAAAQQQAFDQALSPAHRTLLSGYAVPGKVSAASARRLRSPGLTLLMALTGLLFVQGALRAIGKLLLGIKRRGTLALGPRGMEFETETLLLGKRARSSHLFVPALQLQEVRRGTRFEGWGIYAGLLCLALGTYLGTGLLADSLRAPGGSPSLLGAGLALIAGGVLIDFVLSHLLGFHGGATTVIVRTRRGGSWRLDGIQPAEANTLLEQLASHPGFTN